MIEALMHFLQTNILPWGALGVFVASVAEEVIAPIPSAIIMAMAGFLFVSGPLSWPVISALIFKVAIPAALGVTIGSYVVYFVARFGGKYLIERWGKYIGLFWSDVEKLQNRLSGTGRDEVIIGIARAMPFIPSVAVSAFCGIIEMNVVKYFFVSFIGVFFRGITLGILGWQSGNLYARYAIVISKFENIILWSLVFTFLVFMAYSFIRKKKLTK